MSESPDCSPASSPIGWGVIRRCILWGMALSIITVALAVDYAGEEPFGVRRIRDVALYLGFGSASVLGWLLLDVILTGYLLRTRKSVLVSALLATALAGTWIATWTPRAYLQDLCGLDARDP
jgi:hypothetical protein